MDYEKAYNRLFNAITDAIIELNKSKFVPIELDNAVKILKEAQSDTEEMFLN